MSTRYYTKEELSELLNISVDEFHRKVKRLIKKDFQQELDNINVTNPDILLDENNCIRLADPRDHNKFYDTNLNIHSYIQGKMSTTYIDIVFEGTKFSPRKLKKLTGFDIEALAEYGELGEKGRYKGKPMPYGLALLKITHILSEDINTTLSKTIDDLLVKKAALSSSGVDEIKLDLENFSQTDVEITIDKKIIKKISELNASIDISSVSNFHNYFISTYSERDKSPSNAKEYLFDQIYTSIISDTQLTRNFTTSQYERLKDLLKRINTERVPSSIPYTILMSVAILYVARYIREKDFDTIPTFEKVLEETYS